MRNYTFMIVDDEPDAIEVLIYLIRNNFNHRVSYLKANSVSNALQLWKENQIDLIFLDIDLGSQNGFQLLNEIPESYRPPIIFVTAYNEFAIKALNNAALYYITKPVIKNELIKALERFETTVQTQIQQEQFKILIENILQPTSEINRIALPIGDKLEVVAKNKIIRCESESNYTNIFTIDGKRYTVAKTLKEVEKSLPTIFIRIHRSYLININMIKSVDRKNSTVQLVDASIFPIADEKKAMVLELLK